MTSLQKQLAAIAASSTHQLDLKAQKAAHGKSLLFEPRVAASQSFDSIYTICYEGYRDLCALDQRFLPFSRTLFSEQSKSEDRTQMTKKENAQLDSAIDAFMTLVGPRLLLKPAEKALEWLVRRFRVHEYNTECVVMTYLPYHTTPQFLALLSILPASPPPALRFLLPYLTPPTNPPRQAIVYTAANTAQFFAALQRYVVKALQAGHEGSSLLSFWSGITAQAVAAILEQSQSGRKEVQGQRTEELLLKVLPALNECLKMLHAPEALMGSYMVIIIMATKGSFEDKVLDMFLEAVVRSLEPEIMESCLMCLAVIAEERSRPRFPAVVTKRILKVKNLVETLQSLSEQCSIGRLALGCSLGALERGIRLGQDENLTVFRKIVDSKLLDDPHTSLCLSALLQLIPDTAAGSEQHGRLIDLASKLGESPRISQMLRKLTKDHRAQFESLGLSLNHTSDEVEGRNGLSEDEEMVDVDEDMGTNGNVAPVDVPTITATSFLDAKFSEEYSATITAFEKTISSKSRTAEFQSSKELGRDIASEKALFLSFLARTWCSNTSSPTKVAALRSATSTIRLMSEGIDLQHLIPYLICALSDSTPAVRRATATCVNALSAKAAATDSSKGYRVWASSDLYGKDTSKISALPKGQTSSILSSALVPILEECAMDPSFIGASLRTLFGNASTSKQQHGQNLKSAAKTTLASFLASHVAVTPVLRVRLSLFTLFDFSGKLITGPRTNTLLPVVRSWCSLSTSEVTERCAKEDLDVSEVDKVHLAVLVGREPGSIELLKEILLGSINKERTGLLDAAFERLASLWPSLKAEARVSVGQSLLEAALRPECSNSIEELCRVRSLEALRNVKLDTAVLYEFLESIPAALQIPEGPPTKRRRRTSRSEMARLDAHSPDDVAKLVRRVTVILELVEGSNPKEHTALFKNIFAIFGDLQPLRQQSGSDLVYLQSLVLGSLTPMVHGLKDSPDASEHQAAIRVDLLIDCIRHSASPQVQNAALLLIAALASWVPELVLHNLMPIFTFIGSTLLRQEDDYSAHVVDQTVSRVVPQLAASLRAKHKHFLTGVADLLLSFIAAFEHTPHHRRLKLFPELARTLGPEDSLPAITALLVHMYPQSTAQRKFIPELLLQFEPTLTLETFKGYLHLISDAVSAKRTVSDTLFTLNEKQPPQIEAVVNNLLTSLADLATSKTLRSHINKAFRKSRDSSKPRAVFADIVETTIQISKNVKGSSRLYEACGRVLANCLDLLPTTDLISTAELLVTNPDHQVASAVIKAVEVRAGNVIQNDQQAVNSLLSFLPRLDQILRETSEIDVKLIAVSCIDRIVERFGKKDVDAVESVARTISGAQALAHGDDRVRILSLLCLTSVVGVLGEEAIGLLPTVLPTAFKYLKDSIEKDHNGLHNAVFTLLSDIVERLAFVFTREYMVPALELAQLSASSDMDEACDESREQFYQSVANHLGAQEAFVAIKETWSPAISRGYEAAREHLELLLATIEHQTKSQLIKTSSTLFSLFLEMFDLRRAMPKADREEALDEDEVEQLETLLIDSVIAMTLKLNDTTFRPFFVQLVDSAATDDEEANMERSVTLCRFLATFFDRFKSIVTGYSSYAIDHLSSLLTHLATQPSSIPASLSPAVLSALHNSFAHDQDSFWQSPSHYTAILAPLLSQLTIPSELSTPSTTNTSPTHPAIPAITELAAASASSLDNHRQMNAILLKYMRSEDAHTRLATVLCEQSLTKRLGEEWLALLPEMLPFISELREDDDEGVERETQRWIGMVEEVLGEDLEGMLQ